MKKWYKLCPFCANEIKEWAIKCQYCMEFLNDKNPEIKKTWKDLSEKKGQKDKQTKKIKSLNKTNIKWFIIWLILICIFSYFFIDLNNAVWYFRTNFSQTVIDWTTIFYNKAEILRLFVFLSWWYFVYKLIRTLYETKNEYAKVWIYIIWLVVFHLIHYFICIAIWDHFDWFITYISPSNLLISFIDLLSMLFDLR